jgi:hypothetical protein
MWTYFFPERSHITVLCPAIGGRESFELVLEVAGIVHNTTGCHLTTAEMRTLPVLTGVTLARLQTP